MQPIGELGDLRKGQHSEDILTKVLRNFEETWPLFFRVFLELFRKRFFAHRARQFQAPFVKINAWYFYL